jgi:hypothetical protein
VTALLEINNWTGRSDDVYAPDMAAAEDDEPMSGHAMRFPDSLWKAFGEACKAEGTTRSVEVRKFMVAKVDAYRAKQRRIARESSDG